MVSTIYANVRTIPRKLREFSVSPITTNGIALSRGCGYAAKIPPGRSLETPTDPQDIAESRCRRAPGGPTPTPAGEDRRQKRPDLGTSWPVRITPAANSITSAADPALMLA